MPETGSERGTTRVEVSEEANARYFAEMMRKRHTQIFWQDSCELANSYYFDSHGDVPLRRATTLETIWRSRRFPSTTTRSAGSAAAAGGKSRWSLRNDVLDACLLILGVAPDDGPACARLLRRHQMGRAEARRHSGTGLGWLGTTRLQKGHSMAREFSRIDESLRAFMQSQAMFFVATAPSVGGRINLSPKGYRDTFAVLDDHTVAYLDLFGSGTETLAHLRDNGRIAVCSARSPAIRGSCGCSAPVGWFARTTAN